MTHAARESGLTLTELMVTITVFAVLIASSTPIVAEILAGYRLRGATHRLFGELQSARFSAVMQNHRYRVSVVDGSSTYEIHDDKNNDGLANDGDGTLLTRSLTDDAPGVTLSADGPANFVPSGTSLTAATFVLTHPNGKTRSVAVSLGGRIRIQ